MYDSSKICEFCQKKLSNKGNYERHKNICKLKKIKDSEDELKLKELAIENEIIKQKELIMEKMKQEIDSKNKQIELLKSIVLDLINTSSTTIKKSHRLVLDKIDNLSNEDDSSSESTDSD